MYEIFKIHLYTWQDSLFATYKFVCVTKGSVYIYEWTAYFPGIVHFSFSTIELDPK